MILGSGLLQSGYQDVTPPAGWTGYTLPFSIQQSGTRNFRVDPSFDLRSHANITVAKEYFVDTVNGDNGNAGTRAAPFATWNQAAGQADVDRIVLLDGCYCYRSSSSTIPARDFEVIGEGTAVLSSDHANISSDWTLAPSQSNTYVTTISGGNFVSLVCDAAVANSYGHATKYTQRASIAEVESNPGSFYWVSGGTLYVHPVDSRVLSGSPASGDLWLLDGLAFAPTADNRTIYMQNIEIRGGARVRNSSATGGLKFYAKNVTAIAVVLAGCDESIFHDCTIVNAVGDCINYDTRNSVACKFAEIDVVAGDNGNSTSSQATTAHNGCIGVRINGTYRNTAGQNVADVIGCKTWLLGCTASNSTTGIGYNCSTTSGDMWLDGCTSSENDTYDLQTSIGCTILYRNLISGGNFDAGGTIGTY